jgi:hypothetical protein
MWTSRVRTLPPVSRVFAPGRLENDIMIPTPDDSLRSPPLNLRYQEFSKVRKWIKGSTNTAFYPRISSTCHVETETHGGEWQ